MIKGAICFLMGVAALIACMPVYHRLNQRGDYLSRLSTARNLGYTVEKSYKNWPTSTEDGMIYGFNINEFNDQRDAEGIIDSLGRLGMRVPVAPDGSIAPMFGFYREGIWRVCVLFYAKEELYFLISGELNNAAELQRNYKFNEVYKRYYFNYFEKSK